MLKRAFKYKMGKASKYNFSAHKMDGELQKKITKEDDNIVDYLPNAPLQSNLINYEQFA